MEWIKREWNVIFMETALKNLFEKTIDYNVR